jgi:lambda family phage portal protein
MRRRRVAVAQNWIDKFIGYVNPLAGLRRLQARHQSAIASAYIGASKTRRQTKNWLTSGGDADADILPALTSLRERSRDLVRNTPLATGAINTKVTNVVGGGLRLHCRIDREYLGLTDGQADEWESATQREFNLWAKSQDCSADRQGNFYELQDLVFRSTLENGDVFALLPLIPRQARPYSLAVKLIEADRVSNRDNKVDSQQLAGGIMRDSDGAPTHIQIQAGHPGNVRTDQRKWTDVAIFGAKTGRRNVLHIFRRIRIGQGRGVPDLAPVIETFKQIGTYSEAEIAAAVISGMFTVFVETEEGLNPLDAEGASTIEEDSNEIKLGQGAIIDLAPKEKVQFANPTRPNTAFDPFMMSILRQVGVALEIPLELLILHFTASYSASRAALEQAWKFFKSRRAWLSAKFCDPVYAEFLIEAVDLGRIVAPGFLDGDPAVREAYLGCIWIGPAKGHIQPLQEIQAEAEAVRLGSKSLDQVTAETTGEDWEHTHRQRVKEVSRRRADGLQDAASSAPAPPADLGKDPDDADKPESDDEGQDQIDNEVEN